MIALGKRAEQLRHTLCSSLSKEVPAINLMDSWTHEFIADPLVDSRIRDREEGREAIESSQTLNI